MTIVITGGTGFIGSGVVQRLCEEGHRIILLTRNPKAVQHLTSQSLMVEQWDAKTVGMWASRVDGADAVINLAGEPIGEKRWSPLQKARIVESRIDATRAIVDAITHAKVKPQVLVSASGVGYYGDVENEDVTESYPKGEGFLSDTCNQWEREAQAAETFRVRVVMPRFGVVLEKNGGALKKLLFPFKLFAGGPLGSGKQWFPWVHRDDVVEILLFALKNPGLFGPVNVAAPEPVTMKQFCRALGRAMHRPSWAPVPSFVLRTILGEMSEIVLGGQRIIPQKLKTAGYRFRYPKLDEALAAIFRR